MLLITVDTLRADHVGAYAGGAPPTPNLDRLAREGTVFERASTPMPLTRPAHFSMLTSLYPREHGVLNNALDLPGSQHTLPEILVDGGFRTAGFTSVSLLSKESGVAQGFEVFEHPTKPRELPAEDTVPRALAWLGGLGPDERFFLWVHVFDPHMPYAPPEAYREIDDPGLGFPLHAVNWTALKTVARRNEGDVPLALLDFARSLYRGEVEYTDAWLGRLLEGVETSGRLDDTLIILLADHGECFEQGIYFEHADCLFEGAIHIPLIVRLPGEFEEGARSSTPVSAVDVAPTVLRALGLPLPASYSGTPLQELVEPRERYVLVQHPFYQPKSAAGRVRRQGIIRSVAGDPTIDILVDAEKVGVVGSDWKYLSSAGDSELYPLEPTDETRNLAGERGETRTRLQRQLEIQLEAHPLTVLDSGEINEELRETLRALGYLE